MTTLARLTLWHDPAVHAALVDAVDEHLVLILARHGLTDAAPCPRAAIPGLLHHLYPFDTPEAVRAAARALAADSDWQAQLAHLGPLCGPTESSPASTPLRWSLGLYSAPAGPGRAVPAGPGIRRGPWHSFGLPDGLLSPARISEQSGHRFRAKVATDFGENGHPFRFESGRFSASCRNGWPPSAGLA